MWGCTYYMSVCVGRCSWYVVCTAVWVDECQLQCYSLALYYLLCYQFGSLYYLHVLFPLNLTDWQTIKSILNPGLCLLSSMVTQYCRVLYNLRNLLLWVSQCNYTSSISVVLGYWINTMLSCQNYNAKCQKRNFIKRAKVR